MKKLLISPSTAIGRYWASEMGLTWEAYDVITRPEQVRGVQPLASDVVFVIGEPFDYPPHNDMFDELCRFIEQRMIYDV